MHMQCKDPTKEQKLVSPRKACVPTVSTYSTQQVVAHRNTAKIRWPPDRSGGHCIYCHISMYFVVACTAVSI